MSEAIKHQSAFPNQPIYKMPDGACLVIEQGGMTLRDYFAARAMQGLLSNPGVSVDVTNIVQAAWTIADRMMKDREL